MQSWLKAMWIIILVFSIASLSWFIIGSTSYFQRSLDIVGTVILIQVGAPILLMVIISILLLVLGRHPTNMKSYVGVFSCMILLLSLSAYLVHSVNAHGWTKESIRSDSLKRSEDGEYEYRLELINLFRKNSNARLYLKSVETGIEKTIPVDIQTKEITVIIMKKENNWILLTPTEVDSRYILNTTKELGIPEEKFEIDIRAGTSSRLE